MKNTLRCFFVACAVAGLMFGGAGVSAAPKAKKMKGPKVILKLDDLGTRAGAPSCKATMDYLVERVVKASFGIIANRLDATAPEALAPYLAAKNKDGEVLFEMWHHGLDHKKPEFYGTPYEYQKEHFDKAAAKVKEALGVTMHAFGSPYNATDETTNRVIAENPDFRVFMFCKGELQTSPDVVYLNNRVNIENGTGNIQFDHFLKSYESRKDRYTDYMVMQGHPNSWGGEKLAELGRIIDFLQSEGCEFVLPTEYAAGMKKR